MTSVPMCRTPGRHVPRRAGAALLAALAICAVSLADGLAQQDPPQRFRTDVELIQVQAAVVDATGRAVEGLTAADFDLRVDGVRQTIAMFERYGAAPARGSAASVPSGGVAGNVRPPDSPVVVMLMDDLHTWRERSEAARRIARSFVQQMDPRSPIGLVYTSGGGLEITSHRGEVERAIDGFTGRGHRFVKRKGATPLEERKAPAGVGAADTRAGGGGSEARGSQSGDVSGSPGAGSPPPPPPPAGDSPEAGPHLSLFFGDMSLLDSLERVSRQLAGSNAARKVVMLIGEGLPFELQDPFNFPPFIQGEPLHIRTGVQQFLTAALRNNVTVYAVDPRGEAAFGEEDFLGDGLSIFEDGARVSQESLTVMAEETGGTAVVDSDDFEAGVRSVAEEIRTYYLLGFYPEKRRFDGTYRRIEVDVKRPGLTVRARKGYVDARRPAAGEAPPTLGDLASGVLPVPDLGLRLFAVAFRGKGNAGQDARVAVTLEVVAPERSPEVSSGNRAADGSDTVQYLVAAVDLKKKSIKRQRSGTARIRPVQRPDAHGSGLVHIVLDLPPGRYQIRTAAHSARLDRAGSVYLDLEVPDFRRTPLSLSSLVIGYAGAAVPPAGSGPEGFSPTLDRTFASTDRLHLQAEAYLLETGPLDVDLQIVDSTGAERRRDVRRIAAGSGSQDRIVPLNATIPLSDLTTGTYRLRVTARAGEHRAQQEIGFRIQ